MYSGQKSLYSASYSQPMHWMNSSNFLRILNCPLPPLQPRMSHAGAHLVPHMNKTEYSTYGSDLGNGKAVDLFGTPANFGKCIACKPLPQ